MIVNLTNEMEEHLARVTELAEEASNDDVQGFQSRAAAMSACSTMLVQLTKAQESVITMDRLAKVEQVIVDVVKEYLEQNQLNEILTLLEQKLADIDR